MQATRGNRTVQQTFLTAVLVAFLLVFTGCSTKVESSSSGVKTSSSSDGGGSDSSGGSGKLTKDDLAGVLPSAEDVGPDYKVTDSEDSDSEDSTDSESDAELIKACPDAKEFILSDDDHSDASREFETTDDRELEVDLAFVTKADVAKLDKIVQGVSTCKTARFTDSDGVSYVVKLDAEEDDGVGDKGIKVTMKMQIDHESLTKPVNFEYTARMFVVGEVGVTVSVSSGYNESAETETPADIDLLDLISDDVAQKLDKLQN